MTGNNENYMKEETLKVNGCGTFLFLFCVYGDETLCYLTCMTMIQLHM